MTIPTGNSWRQKTSAAKLKTNASATPKSGQATGHVALPGAPPDPKTQGLHTKGDKKTTPAGVSGFFIYEFFKFSCYVLARKFKKFTTSSPQALSRSEEHTSELQ